MMITIDPGLRKLGLATWTDGELQSVHLVQTPQDGRQRDARQWLDMRAAVAATLDVEEPTVVAYEMMQVYEGQRGSSRVNPDNLLQLVGVLGAVLSLFPQARFVRLLPRQWKKPGEQKGVTRRRVMQALTDPELMRLGCAFLEAPEYGHHDMIDAVGIGLAALRRG